VPGGRDTITGFPRLTARGELVDVACNDTPCAVSAIAELAVRIRHGIFLCVGESSQWFP